ncbi:tetratricopeptide repeat protein [Motilimonas cestriensis]|uniref:Tetratricopeptide repeat protein n=1 Tax=Motilimonas cestriensis TaxID=2742685 RepID=A0ABS8WC09_9GAMM|nr:tetratricopeptide repeat protein [Motilimonas cestriensis]MCE2596035.1 tetratricopeptide repeat protein [Motilimonas cestriensis]
MSVINQMNRDLAKRQQTADGTDKVSPVLTTGPWLNTERIIKGLVILVIAGLTLLSIYAWFDAPKETLPVKVAAIDEVETTPQTLPTTAMAPAVDTLQPTLPVNNNQVKAAPIDVNIEQKPSLTRTTLAEPINVQSSDARIKVLDTQVVFLSELAIPETELVEQVAQPVMTTEPVLADSAAVAATADIAVIKSTQVKATTDPQQQSVTTSNEVVVDKATVGIAKDSAQNSTKVVVATAKPATEIVETMPVVAPVVEHVIEKTAKQVAEPIAIDQAVEQVAEPIAVKPTPMGPSSLTITQSNLSDAELIALYQKQAKAAKSKGDLASAQSRLEKALAIDLRHLEVRKELAAVVYGRGDRTQAINLLEQGIQLHPSNADFRLMQSRIYLANQQRNQAFQVLDQLQPNVRQNQDFYATKAALAQQLNQDDKAIIAYLALAKLQPKQAKWWLGLGISQEKLGQQRDALRSYQQADLLGGLSMASMDYVRARIALLQ